jgi:uncharacterized membrane protein (UPF0127 family)
MEKIALLPGGFKPPHAGHYNMAKWLASNTDATTILIKVGAKERDGINREMSLKLWDLYRTTDSDPLAKKLTILPSTSNSPVQDVYDFIENDAPEESIIYLGVGKKDFEDKRFANISKFSEPKGIKFYITEVPPQSGGVSGTDMRDFIKGGRKEEFNKFIPDHLTSEQKEKAWSIVTKLNEIKSNNQATINGQLVPLEIMVTPEDHMTGMMGRNSLDGGMLFPYGEAGQRSFYMKNCLIPLDIIFITKGEITNIHHNCPPCLEEQCQQYTGIADNVLELEGGYCEENSINVGDYIKFPTNSSYEFSTHDYAKSNDPGPKTPVAPNHKYSQQSWNPGVYMKMNEARLFSKDWWLNIINEVLLTEGGAAGHMAHPFDLPNVNSGEDLKDIFVKAAVSLKTSPGAVKIDGVNSSIRLVDLDGQKQFVMDRGSKKPLDIKGITKADLEDRFKPGHGMVKVGGKVLDMFNEALPSIQNDLMTLGAWEDPNILFNMEYVEGKSNVQDYGSNFIAIHGLNKMETKEVQGARKMLTKRFSTEFNYDKTALQSLLDNLAPIAKEKGFEVYGSVPTEMSKEPNFNSALSKQYTVVSNEGDKTQTLDRWLGEMNSIPKDEFIFMNVNNTKKKVGAVSKQVYLAVLKKENVDELFEEKEDKQKAINGFTTYLATEKLGDEILKVLNSPMGSVEDHEGVVIRDKNIYSEPFKITGKFILGGLISDF